MAGLTVRENRDVRDPAYTPVRDRARRGASGALYPQSALAGLNPRPRPGRSGAAARHEALKVGSCATPDREPGQVRKEAAVSGAWWVPQGRLAGAECREASESSAVDGGCTVTLRSFPVRGRLEGQWRRRSSTRRSTGGTGRRPRPRCWARTTWSARSPAPSARGGCTTRSCSAGRAARARPPRPGSWPRWSTASWVPRPSPAAPARSAWPSGRAPTSTSWRSTPPATAGSRTPGSCASAPPPPPPWVARRSTSSTRRSASPPPPSTPS